MDARGVGDDAVPMAVSDSESTDEGAGVAAHPQHTSKVVAVNPFFLERHLGPRATHPDGSANVRAQLTTLWVLGQPGRPQREPPADVPGLATLGERERPWCSCLPTRCGPCHGGPASEPPSGSFDWGDESDTTDAFARRVRCAPTAACAPGRADDDAYDSDDDDEVDPVSAAIAAESRRPGRPSRDAAGCLTGCDASDWSEDSDGTRRRRGRKGCLAGCDGDEDPITGERSRGCLSPAFDLVDGVRDPKTGVRRGGCYACMNGEADPETGERRGGCLDPISGCIFGFEEDEYDDPKDPNRRRRRRRRGGCLGACLGDEDPDTGERRGGCLEPITGCIFGFEEDEYDDSKDPNRRRRRRRRGGCLGACLGDEDPETGARRGGCAGCFLGDVDPETGRRRGVSLGDACVGAEDPDTGARRGGCLASCVGEEDPETGRRRGGCLTACLFGSEDRDGNRRDDGCLAGCDDDDISDDSDRDAKEGDVRARRRRGCLADAFRALCGVGAAARRRRRRRRRRRDRRRRGLEEDEEDDDGDGATTRRDSRRGGKDDGASSSSDSNADDAEWAEAKWRRKSAGYLDVRVAALNARTRAPIVAYEFARPSAVLSALLAAFFAPATWRVLSRAVGPPPGVGVPPPPLRPAAAAEERRARARDVEEAIVDEITHRTLPFLFNRDVEMLGATLGAAFFAASVDASVRARRKEEMFWLAALFPQWLAAAREESRRLRRRRDDVVRMRWHARRRRKRLADAEKWEDVLATGTPAPALVADENGDDDDDDEKGKDPKRRGWEWPSFALPSLSLPSVSLPTVSLPELRDVEIEWRSQTNPDNESRVDYDATVDAALRASVRRHKRQNRKMRAYWAGDADASRTAAKPVDDLKRDDDVDRTIGPTPWKAAS